MLPMVRPLLRLLLLAPLLLGLQCQPTTTIVIHSPLSGAAAADCEVAVAFELVGAFAGPPSVYLNFAPVTVPVVEGPAGHFQLTLGVEDGLADDNLLSVQATRASDARLLTQGVAFTHAPRARAYRITDPADLIRGPLAHGAVGDFMLESCVARFVVQDGPQRDMQSVGQYGGNLIDAERLERPGIDNFLELQPGINVETVVNATSVFVVNDGADGEDAVVRACGPDDLLDFINASTQVTDIGLPFPPNLNDNDQTVEGCTDYALDPRASHVALTTTITNIGSDPVRILSGDWMNAAGELDVLQVPNVGVGAGLTNDLGTMGFVGFDEAEGVDYAYTTLPGPTTGSYVVISGVTVVLHGSNVLLALLGVDPGVSVDPGQSFVMQRFFGVGKGSGSSAVDLEVAVKGTPAAHLSGCVRVGGAPAPGAKVSVGRFDANDHIQALVTWLRTDASGCYAGEVPVPSGPIEYGVTAARTGALYPGGGPEPQVVRRTFTAGGAIALDFDLPATGSLRVRVADAAGSALPARVSVVGFDPSPPILLSGTSLPGFGGSTLALFEDPGDRLPFGIVRAMHTGPDGTTRFDVEPGSYVVTVSRGPEYSLFQQPVTITAGNETSVDARIAHVVDTTGFVSSDFHVHGIGSPDSRVSDEKRVRGYAGEGVDNIVMTDHQVHTDLGPAIDALGFSGFISATVGEEVTTFDSGHYNAYPMRVATDLPSGGSTDWAVAAPPGLDFPSAGAYNATPAEIFQLGTAGAWSTPDTTMQINHIDSHFEPLRIDTALVPPRDLLDAAGRAERRLDEPVGVNLFFPYPALELWNGDSRGDQRQFLEERIGIWFNLLNQGIHSTFIADTDSHRFTSLNMSGARTWTAAAPGSDLPGSVDPAEVANMVEAGKATGGQGVFVTSVLRATDGSGARADLTRFGTTHVSDAGGNVELDIRVQAPLWSAFDTIEVYANAATFPVDPAAPFLYGAQPTLVLSEGDCDPSTVGDGDFDVARVPVHPIPGGERLEANVTVPFSGLTEDTWFVVLVRGSDGVCPALFPVFASGLSAAANATPADLLDGNVGESGVLALGATNALYFDAP